MNFRPLSEDILCEYHEDRVIIKYPPRCLRHRLENGFQPYFYQHQKVISTLRGMKNDHLVKILEFKVQKNDWVIIEYERLTGYVPLQFFFKQFCDIYDPPNRNFLMSELMQNYHSWTQHKEYISDSINSVCNHLQELKLVHGDLAPNNVVWNRTTKQCKIIDLKTVKPIKVYRKFGMFESQTFDMSLITKDLQCDTKYLNRIKTPWR